MTNADALFIDGAALRKYLHTKNIKKVDKTVFFVYNIYNA